MGKCLAKCINCLAHCIDEVISYVSNQAYICIAVHGTSFLSSARKAGQLIAANATKMAVVKIVTSFFIFLAKFCVVLATMLVGYLLLKRANVEEENGSSKYQLWVPLLLSLPPCLIVVNAIFDLYSVAIDTLFVCFHEDMLENNGKKHPYYSSKSLMELMKERESVKKDEVESEVSQYTVTTSQE